MSHSSQKHNFYYSVTFLLSIIAFLIQPAFAAIRLSSDWGPGFSADGRPLLGDKSEGGHMQRVADDVAKDLDASPKQFEVQGPELGFILFLDDNKYYIQPEKFMVKSRPDEVCTPKDYKGFPTYLCDEGQRHTNDCHLVLINSQFEPVSIRRLIVNEPFKTWCNAVPSIGTGNKNDNELLVTIQYFGIESKPASSASDIGYKWKRMTLLFHVNNVDGKVELEPDTSCLKNPNSIESVPDARKELKRCATAQKNSN